MPELALPLRAVALGPLGKGRTRARQTSVRDDHDPALLSVGQFHLLAEPPRPSVGAADPLRGFLAQQHGGFVRGRRYATDPADVRLGKPAHVRGAVDPAVGHIQSWLLARLL